MKSIKTKRTREKRNLPEATAKLTLPFGVKAGDVLTISGLDGRIQQQVIVTDDNGSIAEWKTT